MSDVLKVIDALRLARSGTLSNLRTTLIVIALLRGIWMFNKFDSIWLEAQFRPHYKFFRLDFSLSNYGELLFATEFVRYFAHILIAAVGAIVLNVVAATPGRLRPHVVRLPEQGDLRLRHVLLLHLPAHARSHCSTTPGHRTRRRRWV